MAAVRPVLPIDLAALVGSGRVYPNEAVTLDRIGVDVSPRPLEAAFEQWLSFATGKHTWISVRGATLRGLVSARRRGSKAAWEIDCLIDAAEDDACVLMTLLDRMSTDAGEAGAEKVFLRVPADSDVISIASRCGFVPYTTEMILQANDVTDPGRAAVRSVRRWVRSDSYGTYRLYNRCTPESVRRVEAATFGEWQAAREKIGPRSRQWVIDGEEGLDGWLRTSIAGDVGRFECMAVNPEALDDLVAAATQLPGERMQFCCRTYEFATGIQQALQEAGFAPSREYAVLAKPVAQKIAVPQLAPVVPA